LKLYKVFDFTPERRAMSVVVQDPNDEAKILVFVKGADSSVFPMVTKNEG